MERARRSIRFGLLAAAALVLGLIAGRARAQTADEVVSRGSIDIGVPTELPPHGALDDRA